MSIGSIGGIIAGVAGTVMGGPVGGAAFETALSAASSALTGSGGGDQLQQQMIDGGVKVMGGLMQQLANQVLNEGMEDDGE